MDFDDEDDQQVVNNDSIVGSGLTEDSHKHHHHHHKTKVPDETKQSNGQQTNISEVTPPITGQQQDEWEEFIDPNSKYEQIRLKLAGGTNDDDEYYDDEDGNPNNTNDNNEGNPDRELNKDKPVWKIGEVKQSNETVEEKTEEPIASPPPVKPAAPSTGAYRPPQLRGTGGSGTSVTVVGSSTQRTTKKEKPNLASTDEFPTLGATVTKK